jgi:RND superfamily putative drug exporter
MTGPLYRLGGACAKHHWPVILVWILVAVALALGAGAAGEKNSDNLSLPGTGSTRTGPAEGELPDQAYGTNPVVLEAKSGKLTDSRNSKAISDTVKSLKK